MKNIIYLPIFLYSSFATNKLFASSIKGMAEKLTREVSQVALILATLGMVICGFYHMFGKQDAGNKTVQWMFGICCTVGAGALVNFAKSLG